ncbi:MAG: STAS domain-containing protein [Planctomycetota bacterium]
MQTDLVIRPGAIRDGIATLRLAGVIDAHTLDKFELHLRQACESGIRSLLLDCDEVRYVNSSGFGELVRYSDVLREREGVLVLARVPPKVGIILEMLGLKSIIPVAASIQDGLAAAARKPEIVEAPAGLGPSAPGPSGIPSPVAPPTRMIVPSSDRGVTSSLPVAPPVRVSLDEPTGLRTPISGGEADARTIQCAFCDSRVRVSGGGRWVCPACGAPFSTTTEGGVAFDWSRAGAEAVHLTFDASPRALAVFAGAIEGALMERRVAHARMRRFAREAAHVGFLLGEHAFLDGRRGPLHGLMLAGPQRLHMRLVDRGQRLAEDAANIFATQSRLFLDFQYVSLENGVNLTEFAFAYEGSGVFVG